MHKSGLCVLGVDPTCLPSKHAGSDPEAFWLRPVMAIMASVDPESGRIVKLCRIRLPASVSAPFFQRKRGSCCAKPTRIRSGWPGQGLATRIWSGSKPVCRNHPAGFLAGRNGPAASVPLSDSVLFFQGQSRIILCKTSPDPI